MARRIAIPYWKGGSNEAVCVLRGVATITRIVMCWLCVSVHINESKDMTKKSG